MDPYRLSVWVSIAANYAIYKPSTKAILERYMAKFSRGSKADLNDNELNCDVETDNQ